MRWITRSLLETGDDLSLSPEHWLAADTASKLKGDTVLSELVQSISQTRSPPDDAKFVVDTNNQPWRKLS